MLLCQGGSLLDSIVPLLPSLVVRHYQLTWHDEFNHRPACHLPASERWIADIGHSYPGGAPAWGNNETQKYTTSPANIRVTPSGTLTLTPRLSSNGSWTSARIETQRSDFAATPGGKLYIESRLRTGCAHPYEQQGIWAAFWALGAEFRGNHTNWPAASEWDFVEVVNGLPKVYNTVHCGILPGGPCNETNGLGNGGVGWSICEWHTVGFEVDRAVDVWYKERLKWYLDGEQVFELPASRINSSAIWDAIAHKGHFLLLNVAVGGYWPGQPNATTADGEDVQMEVDYVRIWNT
ncbi:concanavalin A-like lectin/glucanase domain-containing protein [Aspergillus novoparasiticus]|uniref:Concanavalin A-like lectin/glucanase domain-containing protein n=1 Tax=Aspergillus novoparasiticus TaxID=986946 RepID=A0A5N6E6B9_9EURO|nr:concanavalin A-like lectin/glucanase domain-containing protein [Aspergillus novoparasiticus]